MKTIYIVTFYTDPEDDFRFTDGRIAVRADGFWDAINTVTEKLKKIVSGEIEITKVEVLPN